MLVINFFPRVGRAGLPVAAGVAIYVTATDLVPEVNREPGIRMALVFFRRSGSLPALQIRRRRSSPLSFHP